MQVDSNYIIKRNRNTLYKEFRDFIRQEGYPCVGAQAALNSRSIRFGAFGLMESRQSAAALSGKLLDYLAEAKGKPGSFLSYVAIFPEDEYATELEFEKGLWTLLNLLHGIDAQTYNWDPEVSNDPATSNFSFSLGGSAFFMVGMHPYSSRKARRFQHPAIAFNLHEQFEDLRKSGRFHRMKRAIRNNERLFDGSVNPMLSDHGKGLEAPQYSGRKVGAAWKCPFKPED